MRRNGDNEDNLMALLLGLGLAVAFAGTFAGNGSARRPKIHRMGFFVVAAFAIFVLFALASKGCSYLEQQQALQDQIRLTQISADRAAEFFIDDPEYITEGLAKKEITDAWGSEMVLVQGEEGVRFDSPGPDKAFATEDDVIGDWVKPSVTQKLEDKVEEIKDKAKGWKFEWSWGKSGKE